MPDLDLDAIEARAAAAAAGTWEYTEVSSLPRVRLDAHGTCAGLLIADCKNEHLPTAVAEANARFVAHARADVPALVAEVRRLRAELDSRAHTRTVSTAPVIGPEAVR